MRRGADLPRAILDAARRLYLQDGLDGVSARRIAECVGVSATAIYLHYRSIDALLDQVRLEGHELLARYLRDAGGDTAADQVRAMGRAYHRFGLEQRSWFELMFAAHPRGRRRQAVQREMFTLLLLRDAVQRGVDAGEFRRDVDVLVATNALWAEIHGLTALAVSGLLVETSAGHADEVLAAVLDAALAWLVAPARKEPR